MWALVVLLVLLVLLMVTLHRPSPQPHGWCCTGQPALRRL